MATAIAVCGAGVMGDAQQDDTPAGTGSTVEVVHFEGDRATDGTGQLGASIRPEDDPVMVDDVIDRKDFRMTTDDNSQTADLLGGQQFEAFSDLDDVQAGVEIGKFH